MIIKNALNTHKSPSTHCVFAIAQPTHPLYLQAIAGDPIEMRFSRNFNSFILSYKPDTTVKAPTEIFLPPYRYPNGYDVELDPPNATFTSALCPGQDNKLCVSTVGKPPLVVTVTVTPKKVAAP